MNGDLIVDNASEKYIIVRNYTKNHGRTHLVRIKTDNLLVKLATVNLQIRLADINFFSPFLWVKHGPFLTFRSSDL